METEGYMFMMIVRAPELIEELLASLMEAGVSGVTLFDTRGISKASFHRTVSEFSIAAVMSSLFTSEKPETKVLMVLVETREMVDELCRRADAIVKAVDKPDSGIHFALPVTHLRGLRE
jgi:nitrogen regulatory protein PII